MIAPPQGIKKQVFGGVLFCLSILTALLSRIIGFELDIFYVVIGFIGAGLFLYGALQKNQSGLTTESQQIDGRCCAEADTATKATPH